MNSCNFIGRIGRDAVVRDAGGTPVAGWALAVDSGFGDRKQTLWFDCSLWGKRANSVAEYIRKGDQLGVTGELGTREHEGKTYHTLKIADVTLIGGKGKHQSEPSQPRTNPVPNCPQDNQGNAGESNVPF